MMNRLEPLFNIWIDRGRQIPKHVDETHPSFIGYVADLLHLVWWHLLSVDFCIILQTDFYIIQISPQLQGKYLRGIMFLSIFLRHSLNLILKWFKEKKTSLNFLPKYVSMSSQLSLNFEVNSDHGVFINIISYLFVFNPEAYWSIKTWYRVFN